MSRLCACPRTVALVLTLCLAATANAQLTPQNPRVREAIDRAVSYLEQQKDGRVGARALMGLTFSKYGAEDDHPKIAEAIRTIQAATKDGPEKVRADIYSTGIAIMCLVAIDPSQYRYEIETLVESLHLRQKRDGAWGYPATHPNHGQTCDTSMTQYAVLGLWEAEDQAGVETPPAVWDRVARWLILTQDPTGGFGYQGKPAARMGRNETQAGVRHSMSAAAMSSMYIVKDRVGIRKLQKASTDNTPAAFEPYETQQERNLRLRTRIDLRHFAKAMSMGNRWIEDKYDVENLKTWIFYSLYAIERYESFREAEAAGSSRPVPKSERSKWYNRGARYLIKEQKEDGSWESNGGPVPDTCFATLFLLGSTRKTLASASATRYASGQLIGGRGLPKMSERRLRDGRVVVKKLDVPPDKWMAILNNPSHAQYDQAIESLADWGKTADAKQLQQHHKSLAQLALVRDRDVRVLALQAIARSRDLDQVPLLIHLLEDDDADVVRSAGEALGTISRKYTTFGADGRENADQRRRAIQSWKDWYRSIRPDADVDAWKPAEGRP